MDALTLAPETLVSLIEAETQYQAARDELARLAGLRDLAIVCAVTSSGDVAAVVRNTPRTMTGRTVRRALDRLAPPGEWDQLDLLDELTEKER